MFNATFRAEVFELDRSELSVTVRDEDFGCTVSGKGLKQESYNSCRCDTDGVEDFSPF